MVSRFARLRVALAVVLGMLVVAALVPTAADNASTLVALAGAAAVSIAAAALVVHLTAAAPARAIRVGQRAERHREALDRQTEPAHPDTAGRPRPRAPGRPLPAA